MPVRRLRYIPFVLLLLFAAKLSAQPVITSFLPTSGPVGTQVLIKGDHFGTVTLVSFGGVPATSFSLLSYVDSVTHQLDTAIFAVVGSGATGLVSVTTSQGTATLGIYTFTTAPLAPMINSFSPTSGGSGTTVTIKGKYFGE